MWDLVEADCRKALELDNGSTKVRIRYQAVINLEVVFIDVCKVCHMLQCIEANQKLNSFLQLVYIQLSHRKILYILCPETCKYGTLVDLVVI